MVIFRNRLIFCGFLFFFFVKFVYSQPWMSYIKSEAPNFYEIKSGFEKYLEDKIKENPSLALKNSEHELQEETYQIYKRWEWYWESRINEKGMFPNLLF